MDLVPGADPVGWPEEGHWETTNDDWNKVGGTALTLQGGADSFWLKDGNFSPRSAPTRWGTAWVTVVIAASGSTQMGAEL
ncbi:MAG TPA: hypothetical protein VHK65_08100 [Candidatus Dormibacteraeota bacterium]|nr:hypothetical protein [Candidatus Dormibacteraeota bacterium]